VTQNPEQNGLGLDVTLERMKAKDLAVLLGVTQSYVSQLTNKFRFDDGEPVLACDDDKWYDIEDSIERFRRYRGEQTKGGSGRSKSVQDLDRKIKELQYQREERRNAVEEGRYIDRQEVRDAAQTFWSNALDRLLDIPENYPQEIREQLNRDIRNAVGDIRKDPAFAGEDEYATES